MESWTYALDHAVRLTRQVFGQSGIVRLAGADPVDATVILDYQYVEQVLGGGEVVSTYKPIISVRDADLPRRPRKGDLVEVAGVTYRVEDAQEDSSGMTRCICVRL